MDSYKRVSLWLRVVSFLFIALIGIIKYLSMLEEGNGHSSALGGATATFFIFGIISLVFGSKCVQWALKNKKNPNWAYFFGFFLWWFGFLGYWAYHKKKDYREELRQSHLEVLKRGKR